MAAHNTLGKTGEDAAVAYLERNGYTINHRNWQKKPSRTGHCGSQGRTINCGGGENP